MKETCSRVTGEKEKERKWKKGKLPNIRPSSSICCLLRWDWVRRIITIINRPSSSSIHHQRCIIIFIISEDRSHWFSWLWFHFSDVWYSPLIFFNESRPSIHLMSIEHVFSLSARSKLAPWSLITFWNFSVFVVVERSARSVLFWDKWLDCSGDGV